MNKRIILLIDTEGDLYYNVPNPHFSWIGVWKWRLNKILGRLYRYPQPSRDGLLNIVYVLKKYKFPAIFCISGHLYLKECLGWRHFNELKPENKWYKKIIGDNWYYWDKGGNYKNKGGLYFGDIIESEMKNTKYFTFGLHGFGHEALTLERKEVIESIVQSGIGAASRLGIKIKAFAAPFNMIEDVNSPGKVLNILKKYGIKTAAFQGKDNGFDNMHNKTKLPTISKIKGLELVASRYYVDGQISIERINQIADEIRNSNEEVVAITTHDFTWKSKEKFDYLIKSLKSVS